MKVVNFGDSVVRNLDNPSDLSIASVCAWARFEINLGKLNDLIHTTYSVNNDSLEILDENGVELGLREAAVYESMFRINYFSRQVSKSLGVGGLDILQSVKSDGGEITFINRNQLSLSWNQMKKDEKIQLDKMINYFNHSSATPSQVVGDDTNVETTSNRLGSNTIVSSQGGSSNNTMP